MEKVCYIRKGIAYKFEDEPKFEDIREFTKDLQNAKITNLGENFFPGNKLLKRDVYTLEEEGVDYILVDQGNEEEYSGETKPCCDACDLEEECSNASIGIPCGCEFDSSTLRFCKKV